VRSYFQKKEIQKYEYRPESGPPRTVPTTESEIAGGGGNDKLEKLLQVSWAPPTYKLPQIDGTRFGFKNFVNLALLGQE
jgi:hypothetical protein